MSKVLMTALAAVIALGITAWPRFMHNASAEPSRSEIRTISAQAVRSCSERAWPYNACMDRSGANSPRKVRVIALDKIE